MRINSGIATRTALLVAISASLTVSSSRLRANTGTCGGASITVPFTDVAPGNAFFCSIAEAYFSGLTNGTSATTYNPSDPVPRAQMAAFITRTLDQSLTRTSRRLVLGQWWTPASADNLGLTFVGITPVRVKSDGADLWVANFGFGDVGSGSVSRVRASDGRLLETWTATDQARSVLVAMGRIFVTGQNGPGLLYQIDPTQPAGAATIAATGLGADPNDIAFDGAQIWTANNSFPGSVSVITPGPTLPWTVTNITAGFTQPLAIFFDGSNIWVVDGGKLKKLDSSGNIIQTVPVSFESEHPAFDGTNIWVPNFNSQTITVVRASTGTILATLSGNGLNNPSAVAFDGQRMLVTNFSGDSVSVWKANDLTPVGVFPTGLNSTPNGACSDGTNFWILLQGTTPGKLARF